MLLMFQQIYNYAKQYPYPTFFILMFLFFLLGDSIIIYLMQTQIKPLPRTVFLLTFISSLEILVLVIFDILQIGSDMDRIFLWKVTLTTLTIDCILIPALIIFKLSYIPHRTINNSNQTFLQKIKQKIFSSTLIKMITFLVIIFYLFMVCYKCFEINNSKKNNVTNNNQMGQQILINTLIQFITHYGTIIMAIMSGYGAVWCPYTYKNMLYTKKQQLMILKKELTQQINFILKSIVKIKYEILFLRQKKNELLDIKQKKQSSKNKAQPGFIGRFFNSFFTKDQNQQELTKIQQRFQFLRNQQQTLEKAHRQNFDYYKQIVDQVKKHQISQTFLGKLFKLFSLFLSIYTFTRLIFTTKNLIFGRGQSNDPISRILFIITYFTGQIPLQTHNAVCSYISFGFMGYLIFTNVRSFSINMKNLFDYIFRRGFIKNLEIDIIVLILSVMYGVYFITALILLQMSLPSNYRNNLAKVTGKIDIINHFNFFDLIFLSCSICFLVIIISTQRKSRNKKKIFPRNYQQENKLN